MVSSQKLNKLFLLKSLGFYRKLSKKLFNTTQISIVRVINYLELHIWNYSSQNALLCDV